VIYSSVLDANSMKSRINGIDVRKDKTVGYDLVCSGGKTA